MSHGTPAGTAIEHDEVAVPAVANLTQIDAQNALTQSYLAAVPGRDVFHRRLSALLNYEQVSPPIKRGRLLTTYLVDAKTEVRRFAMDGTPDGIVELPGIGSAGGF